MRGLRLEQLFGHTREAVRILAERLQHLGHIARGEVAVEQIPLVIAVKARILLGLLAPDLVPALPVDEELAHHVGIVVVGVDKDIFKDRVQIQTADLRVLADLALPDALGQEHHQRHLVHAAGIEPRVGVMEPFLAGGGIAVADAHAVGRDILLLKEILHHLRDGGVVQKTVARPRFRLRRLRGGRQLGLLSGYGPDRDLLGGEGRRSRGEHQRQAQQPGENMKRVSIHSDRFPPNAHHVRKILQIKV